jgi:TusA-related sulfurtransferase
MTTDFLFEWGRTGAPMARAKGTNDDIPLWCKKIGHEYLVTIADAGYWRTFVKRLK